MVALGSPTRQTTQKAQHDDDARESQQNQQFHNGLADSQSNPVASEECQENRGILSSCSGQTHNKCQGRLASMPTRTAFDYQRENKLPLLRHYV